MRMRPMWPYLSAENRQEPSLIKGPFSTHVNDMRQAKFMVGQVVKHRIFPFRGVIFDVDPTFDNTDEWWLAIPEEIRPRKDQPFYHLLADKGEMSYVAYVSEQNLLPDDTGAPIHHPQVPELFEQDEQGKYRAIYLSAH